MRSTLNAFKEGLPWYLLGSLLSCAVLTGCTDPPYATKDDAAVTPKVEGCTFERYVVKPGKGWSAEILYVARCVPSTTTSVTTQYGCGKGCTKRVTTVTTVEGTPPEERIEK